MTNYASGHAAEKAAAAYLEAQGYTVLALNWRQRRAEIDIVARRMPRWGRKGPLTFFEVKYRRTSKQGNGLEYITPKKLEQMRFAAHLWMAQSGYDGPCTLGAIEVSGADYEITACLEII